MKKLILILLLAAAGGMQAQAIFSNSFGDTAKPAVLFLHDGPGANPVSFEIGCANALADAGFYVITFDQRGCGRSKKDSVTDRYKFNKANLDINTTLKKYKVSQAFLIGQGWGGTMAIKYAEAFPEKVKGIVLVASPLNYQLMYKSVLQACEEKFEESKDTSGLRKLAVLRKSDTTKLDYRYGCTELALKNGLDVPARPGSERVALYEEMKKNKKWEYVGKTTAHPVYGFFMNEQYTTLDMNYYVKKVIDKKIPVYGVYGNDDGLFNAAHISMIKRTLGDANVVLVNDASHSVFLDQRSTFVQQLKKWMTPPPEPQKKGKK